jgi:hypothetical protein
MWAVTSGICIMLKQQAWENRNFTSSICRLANIQLLDRPSVSSVTPQNTNYSCSQFQFQTEQFHVPNDHPLVFAISIFLHTDKALPVIAMWVILLMEFIYLCLLWTNSKSTYTMRRSYLCISTAGLRNQYTTSVHIINEGLHTN